MMLDYGTILVLSPHTDDGELGAGGTTSRFAKEGKTIYYVAFSPAKCSIPKNFPKDTTEKEYKKAAEILGVPSENIFILDYEPRSFPTKRQEILEEMIKINQRIKPDLVLVPSSNDLHQDHQVIHIEALRAFKTSCSIWGYEHPWNNLTFTMNIFVQLKEEYLENKMEALAQYKSQDFRIYFNAQYIRALAYSRGIQVNFPYAQAFEGIRLLVK